MQEVDINTLVNKMVHRKNYLLLNVLKENIPDNVIIIGKINIVTINHKYDKLDLSKVKCNEINYRDQGGESIKNHILPNSLKEICFNNNKLRSLPNLPNSLIKLKCSNNRLRSLPNLPLSLKELYCSYNQLKSLPDLPNSLRKLECEYNELVLLPKLPNSLKKINCSNNKLELLHDLPDLLKELICSHNKLTSLSDLPNSLAVLWCSNNQLTSLPNLPDSLKNLDCGYNELILFPDLPNSLIFLDCNYNQLNSLPDFTHLDHIIILYFEQDLPIEYIPYNTNIELYGLEPNKIIIDGYPHNPITNQKELDRYMKYIKNYQLNRIKSARK